MQLHRFDKLATTTTMKYTTLALTAIALANNVYANQESDSFVVALKNEGFSAPDSPNIWPLATMIENEGTKAWGEAFKEAWRCTRYLALCDYYEVNRPHSHDELTIACQDHRDDLYQDGSRELDRAFEEFKEYEHKTPVSEKALFELRYLLPPVRCRSQG